jgi:hypothetical protein
MTIILKISLVLGGLNTLAAACDNNPVGVERVQQQHALPHLERILVSGPSLGTRSDYHLEECLKRSTLFAVVFFAVLWKRNRNFLA